MFIFIKWFDSEKIFFYLLCMCKFYSEFKYEFFIICSNCVNCEEVFIGL